MYMPIAIVTTVPKNPRTRNIIRSGRTYLTNRFGKGTASAPEGPGSLLLRLIMKCFKCHCTAKRHRRQVTRVQVLGTIWSCRLKEYLQEWQTGFRNGDPGGSRTPNPQLRRLMLYPVELRGRPPEVSHSEPAESILHRSQPRMPTEIRRAL